MKSAIPMANWELIWNPYRAPEIRTYSLIGWVHERRGEISEPRRIQTSQIVKVEGTIITTRNSRYRLIGHHLDLALFDDVSKCLELQATLRREAGL